MINWWSEVKSIGSTEVSFHYGSLIQISTSFIINVIHSKKNEQKSESLIDE